MKKSGPPTRLTHEDAAFVNFERPAMPMNVGSVGIYEGRVPFEQFVAHTARRIARVPRYRQRLVPVPYGLAHAAWIEDPEFDVRRQVERLYLPPPGDDLQLAQAAAEVFAEPLDRGKPLWEIRMVYGLQGGRTAHIAKVHHCMVDGIAGIGLLAALLDADQHPQRDEPAQAEDPPPPLPTRDKLVLDAIFDRIEELARQAEGFWLNVLNPMSFVQRLGSVASAFEKAGPYFVVPAAPTPWNRRLTSPNRIIWQVLPLEPIREAARRARASLNDVILTMLAGVLRRYLESGGHRARGVTLRVAVPVNVRRPGEHDSLGNRVSFMLASLPIGEPDPLARLHAIHEETLDLKRSGQPDGVDEAIRLLGNLPPMAHLLVGRSLALPNRLANLICTNVPGPKEPLYCMGHKMVAHYPWVPLGWRMGLNLAVMSYDGDMYFSFSGDAHLPDDPAPLADYIKEELASLCASLGVAAVEPAGSHASLPEGGERQEAGESQPQLTRG